MPLPLHKVLVYRIISKRKSALMQGVRSLYSSHMHESLSISKSLNDLSALYVVHLDKLFKLL